MIARREGMKTGRPPKNDDEPCPAGHPPSWFYRRQRNGYIKRQCGTCRAEYNVRRRRTISQSREIKA